MIHGTRLLLRLDSDPTGPVHWIRVDRSGVPEADGRTEDLHGLVSENPDRGIIVLAAGADVLLTRVNVPTQNRQKLLRAVPYALEEQLAGDVEDAHFVLGAREDAGWAVAVLQTAWLDNWLQRLADAGLQPRRILPETLCLPRRDDAWTVLVDATRFVVRTGSQDGFGGDSDNLEVLLEAALEECGEARPQRILVFADGVDPDLPAAGLGVDVVIEPADTSRLIAAGVDDNALDLLTGPYAPADHARTWWRPWLPIAVLLAVWLSLDLGLAVLDQRSLQAEINRVESRAMNAYQAMFPGAGNLDQARTRVGNRLRQAGGNDSGQQDMLDTLRLIGPNLMNGGDFLLRGLSYRGGILELELETSTLQELDRLQQRLDGNDEVSAEVRSARSEEDGVLGRMVVRRTGQ